MATLLQESQTKCRKVSEKQVMDKCIEMPSGIIQLGLNASLMGVSGYALSSLDATEHCFGFALAAFCFMHGLMGLIRTFRKADPDECNSFHIISSSIMEILPLPVANMQLYLASSKSSAAWLHGLSVFPFLYDVSSKLNDDCDDTTETLKDITVLGNAGSAIYLSQQEGKPIYGVIGVLALIMHYGSLVISNLIADMNSEFELLTNTIIVYLMTLAMTGGGGEGGSEGGSGGDSGGETGGGGESAGDGGGASQTSVH